MNFQNRHLDIIAHYEKCLKKYGDNHLGVDWPNLKDAENRYQIMLELIKEPVCRVVSLLDFGCGTSHLFDYINKRNIKSIKYYGLDISKKFINICRRKYPKIKYYCTDIIGNELKLPRFDYIVMNGVFTEKQNLENNEMFDYFKKMIKIIFRKARKGIAFNVMSKAVDWERSDLFHVSIDMIVDFITKNLKRHFIIRNDYGLYEYTVYIYREPTIKLCLK